MAGPSVLKACLYQARVMLDLGRARVAARQLSLEPLDLVYLQGVEANLAEWNSQADEEAFGDL
jgi:hypothetical protein